VTVIGCVVFASLLTIGMAAQTFTDCTAAGSADRSGTLQADVVSRGQGQFRRLLRRLSRNGREGAWLRGASDESADSGFDDDRQAARQQVRRRRVLVHVAGTGRTATPAHGIEAMPIWGDAFRTVDTARATLRVNNLVKYLETIQQLPASR